MSQLIQIEGTFRPRPPRFALWQLAFRPFFLAAALFAVVSIFLWVGSLSNWFQSIGFFEPVIWHSHEMVYGLSSAVVAGFVLTASQNWTGKRGVNGWKLQLLVALWFAGRLLVSLPTAPRMLAMAVDLGFYPVVELLLFPYLKDAEMKVERVFFLYLASFFSGNLLIHLDGLGLAAFHGYSHRAVILGLDTLIVMIVFMGGRVIPFFTESSIAKSQPRVFEGVEIMSHVAAWTYLVVHFALPNSIWLTGTAMGTAVIHFIRLILWQVKRVRRIPLIWVLHASYLWIVIGYFLTALVSLGLIAAGPALHAHAIGGIGLMVYGMMSRVALGHTGRRLHPSAWIVVGYVLILIAAVIRIVIPILDNLWLLNAVKISGLLWIVAFGLFLIVYTPQLIRARVDGRVG